jgi:hypothetical protein
MDWILQAKDSKKGSFRSGSLHDNLEIYTDHFDQNLGFAGAMLYLEYT